MIVRLSSFGLLPLLGSGGGIDPHIVTRKDSAAFAAVVSVGRHCNADKCKCQDSNPDLQKFSFAPQTVTNLTSYRPNVLTTSSTHPLVPSPLREGKYAFTLAEVFSPHCAGSRKTAFTLAEVLITLGIIGVVAAITMPVLTAKIDEMVMVNRLKSTYSIVLNAINMRKYDIGANDYSDVFPENTVLVGSKTDLNDLLKYLKPVEVCEARTSGCGGNYKVKYPQAQNDGYGKNKYVDWSQNPRAVLANGAIIWLQHRNTDGTCQFKYQSCPRDENGNFIEGAECTEYYVSQCAEVFMDINGPKGKNQFGYDCFAFTVEKNKIKQIVGYGSIDETIRTGKLNYKNYEIGADFVK